MSKSKTWRVNYVIVYEVPQNVFLFRQNIQNVLKGLSFLYNIECKIISDHPIVPVDDSGARKNPEDRVDIAFFRSTSESEVSAKEFRDLLNGIFCKSQTSRYGVDTFHQVAKFLSYYPFPE